MRIKFSYACIDGDKEDTGDENHDEENSDEVCFKAQDS